MVGMNDYIGIKAEGLLNLFLCLLLSMTEIYKSLILVKTKCDCIITTSRTSFSFPSSIDLFF